MTEYCNEQCLHNETIRQRMRVDAATTTSVFLLLVADAMTCPYGDVTRVIFDFGLVL
jgi:hypothetical protein